MKGLHGECQTWFEYMTLFSEHWVRFSTVVRIVSPHKAWSVSAYPLLARVAILRDEVGNFLKWRVQPA